MAIFGYSRALGVAVMAWGMVSFGPASDLAAGTLLSPGSADLVRKSAEPFGVFAFRLADGGLWEKWLGVLRKLDDEQVQLALCDGDRERCVSPAALRFLAIVDNAKAREGRSRLGEINRVINLAIHPMSDLAQYGEIDVWSSPLLTFTTGHGDCEDYAIAKFVALQEAGVSPDDLRIVSLEEFQELAERVRMMYDYIAASTDKDPLPVKAQRWLSYLGLEWPQCFEALPFSLATDLQREETSAEEVS